MNRVYARVFFVITFVLRFCFTHVGRMDMIYKLFMQIMNNESMHTLVQITKKPGIRERNALTFRLTRSGKYRWRLLTWARVYKSWPLGKG